MHKKLLHSEGFSPISAVAASLVLIVVLVAGIYVYKRDHTQNTASVKRGALAQKDKSSTQPTLPQPDPYAGWKTYCDNSTRSCIKRPADWAPVSGFPGAFENSANTGYVSLELGTNKDTSEANAYVYSVDSVTTSAGPLDIVGYIVNDKPEYSVYDASYVSANDVKADATVQIVVGNYAFHAKTGTASLAATPGAQGYATIKDYAQAKAWFTSPDAASGLQVLKSFYYN